MKKYEYNLYYGHKQQKHPILTRIYQNNVLLLRACPNIS